MTGEDKKRARRIVLSSWYVVGSLVSSFVGNLISSLIVQNLTYTFRDSRDEFQSAFAYVQVVVWYEGFAFWALEELTVFAFCVVGEVYPRWVYW